MKIRYPLPARGGAVCMNMRDGWCCTQVRNHPGDVHMAGDTRDEVLASWSDLDYNYAIVHYKEET